MKTALILAFTMLCSLAQARTGDKLRGAPSTLNETFLYLDKIFSDDTSKYGFMTLPEFYLPLHYQMSLGQYMRTHWGLDNNGKLKRWFVHNGIENPDDMTGIILTSYHRYLNHQPIDLEGQIKMRHFGGNGVASRNDSMNYIYDFKEMPSQKPLLQKFPVGDTIMIYTAAETQAKAYSGPVSLRAFAVVRAHNGEALLFEITHIDTLPNTKCARSLGDLVEGYPSECYQLPPKGWTWKESLLSNR